MLSLPSGLQLAHTAYPGHLAKGINLGEDAVPSVHGLTSRTELDFSPSSGRRPCAVASFAAQKMLTRWQFTRR